MTITSVVAKTSNLPGDGTNFSFSFSPIVMYKNAEVVVTLTVTATGVETTLTEGTAAANYSVTFDTSFPSTGNIIYPATETGAIASTSTITIKRVITLDQQTDLENQGGYDAETLEEQLDKIVVMIQQQQEEIDRCLKIPISDVTITSTEINSDALRTATHTVQVSGDATTFITAAAASTTGSASDATPVDINISSAIAGSGADYSRSDHRHTIPATIPTTSGENTFTESNIWFKGSDVASGATLTLGAGNWFDITGTTAITDITTVGAGFLCLLHFDGALTFTHDGDDIICPGNEDITTQAGMEILLYEHTAGKWRVLAVNDQVPVHLRQSVDLSQKVTFFDDFIGTISTPIESTAGSGGGTAAATISAGDGGRVTLSSSTADGTNAANTSTLTLDTLDWSADQGGLILETRLAINDVSEAALFVGFTDNVMASITELPIFKTSGADTIDSDATDACGIGYDIDGTTDEFFHGGVDTDVDTAATHSGSAPTDNTFVTLRVEVTSAGAVRGFINGIAIGAATSSAITATTAITPCIVISNRSANQVIATIDYIHVQANR